MNADADKLSIYQWFPLTLYVRRMTAIPHLERKNKVDENWIDVAEDMSTSKSAAGKPKRVVPMGEIKNLQTDNRKVFHMDDDTEQTVFHSSTRERRYVFHRE